MKNAYELKIFLLFRALGPEGSVGLSSSVACKSSLPHGQNTPGCPHRRLAAHRVCPAPLPVTSLSAQPRGQAPHDTLPPAGPWAAQAVGRPSLTQVPLL